MEAHAPHPQQQQVQQLRLATLVACLLAAAEEEEVEAALLGLMRMLVVQVVLNLLHCLAHAAERCNARLKLMQLVQEQVQLELQATRPHHPHLSLYLPPSQPHSGKGLTALLP